MRRDLSALLFKARYVEVFVIPTLGTFWEGSLDENLYSLQKHLRYLEGFGI